MCDDGWDFFVLTFKATHLFFFLYGVQRVATGKGREKKKGGVLTFF